MERTVNLPGNFPFLCQMEFSANDVEQPDEAAAYRGIKFLPFSNAQNEVFALSRKQKKRSIGRHFTPWKMRLFIIDPSTGVLTIRSKNKPKPSLVNLRCATISVHHYVLKDASCVDSERVLAIAENDFEIFVKFSNDEQFSKWKNLLSSVSSAKKSLTREDNQTAIEALRTFFTEKDVSWLTTFTVATSNAFLL